MATITTGSTLLSIQRNCHTGRTGWTRHPLMWRSNGPLTIPGRSNFSLSLSTRHASWKDYIVVRPYFMVKLYYIINRIYDFAWLNSEITGNVSVRSSWNRHILSRNDLLPVSTVLWPVLSKWGAISEACHYGESQQSHGQ